MNKLKLNRIITKYTSSARLMAEIPRNKPSKPPTFARKSVRPYSSDLLDAKYWFSLKKIRRAVIWYLKEALINGFLELERIHILREIPAG